MTLPLPVSLPLMLVVYTHQDKEENGRETSSEGDAHIRPVALASC